MALVYFDDDPWIAAHDACEKLSRNIQSQIVTWRAEPRTSAEYGTLSANIRFKLKQYNTEIQQLKELLEKTTKSLMITDAEGERRSRQIEVLQSKHIHLQKEFSNGIQSFTPWEGSAELQKDKRELFGGSSNNRGGEMKNVTSVNWGTGSDDEDLLDTNSGITSVHQVRMQHQQVMKEQDRGLEELSKVIARQKDIASTIGNEVALHNEILDDLTDRIDRTDSRVQQETGQIRSIDMKDSTCGLWTTIIMLFVAILLVAILL